MRACGSATVRARSWTGYGIELRSVSAGVPTSVLFVAVAALLMALPDLMLTSLSDGLFKISDGFYFPRRLTYHFRVLNTFYHFFYLVVTIFRIALFASFPHRLISTIVYSLILPLFRYCLGCCTVTGFYLFPRRPTLPFSVLEVLSHEYGSRS